MDKPKMLILEDCEIMLQNLEIAITKYDVIPAQTLDEAIELIETKNISFIVTDIKLKEADKGYQLFERLFSNGKLIPGIVMTAFVVEPDMQKELSRIGVTRVIQKNDFTDMSDVLESIADEILNDETKRLTQLTNKVREFKLLDKPFGQGKGSIRDCLNGVLDGKYSDEDEQKTIDYIMQRCNRAGYPDNRDLPPGHTIGYLSD